MLIVTRRIDSGACAVAVTSGGVTMENCVLTGNKSVYSKYGFIVYVYPVRN